MQTIDFSTFQSKTNHYLNWITRSSKILCIAQNDQEENGIVMMSIKEYNALTETAHLLSTVANRKRLEESLEKLKDDL